MRGGGGRNEKGRGRGETGWGGRRDEHFNNGI